MKLSELWPSWRLYSNQEEWGAAAGMEVTGRRGVERKVSGAAAAEREAAAWWAPNEQIMTGSILQDGGQLPPTPLSPPPTWVPSQPPPSPPHTAPPLFSYLSDSSISPLSPPCSCLLIVSEALSLGPPTRLRSEGIAASQGGDWNVKMLSETASTRRDGGHTRKAAPAVSWPTRAAGDSQNGAREGN